jgi:hypothetical protein
MAILPNLAQEASARIAELEAQVAALKAQPSRKLTMKVTATKADGTGSSGAISVYGLGRFPVTLYAASWERLLDASDEIKAFISANAATISRK